MGTQLVVQPLGAHQASSSVELVREDIGRHNALDKVVGRLVLDGRVDDGALAGHAVVVSSRASFEMVHKAWAAGIGSVVAVSAPSALAVATATHAGMNLVGFVRGTSFNVYAGRVTESEAVTRAEPHTGHAS